MHKSMFVSLFSLMGFVVYQHNIYDILSFKSIPKCVSTVSFFRSYLHCQMSPSLYDLYQSAEFMYREDAITSYSIYHVDNLEQSRTILGRVIVPYKTMSLFAGRRSSYRVQYLAINYAIRSGLCVKGTLQSV